VLKFKKKIPAPKG